MTERIIARAMCKVFGHRHSVKMFRGLRLLLCARCGKVLL